MNMFLYIAILRLLILSSLPEDAVGTLISVGELNSCQDNGHVSEACCCSTIALDMVYVLYVLQ